mmetsp:Transcript_52816/g.139023  ORF Transcript_52816/g.139023 Transcript_52816/m.139023 type:complete len:115 (-) Transcript_52816:730-1074(-)
MLSQTYHSESNHAIANDVTAKHPRMDCHNSDFSSCCDVHSTAGLQAARLRCLVLEREAMMCWGGPPPAEDEQRAQLKLAEENVIRLRSQVESIMLSQADSASVIYVAMPKVCCR